MAEPAATEEKPVNTGVPVFDPHARKVVRIAPKDLRQAEMAGAHVVSEKEANESALQEKYGGLAGQATAIGAGLARGATIGASDVALRHIAEAFGGEEGRKAATTYVREAGQANPVESIGSEIVGVAGPLLATDGAAAPEVAEGLTARGLFRGAGILPRAVTGAGHAVEHGVAGLLGHEAASFGGRVAQKVIPKLAGGALEGGAFGAGASVSEQALEDHDLVAEKILAEAGKGAMLGGAIAAGPTLLGTLGKRAFSGIGDMVARKSESSTISKLLGAEETAADTAAHAEAQRPDFFSRVASTWSGKEAEDIHLFKGLNPESARARQIAVHDAPQIVDSAMRNITADGNELGSSLQNVMDKAIGGFKLDYIKSSTRGGANALEHANGEVDALIDSIQKRLENPNGVYSPKSLESLSKSAYRAKEGLERALQEGGEEANAKAFFELDNLKRATQEKVNSVKSTINHITDSEDKILAKENLKLFDTHAERLRSSLESEARWGKMGPIQADVNEKWHQLISAKRDFNQQLTTEMGIDPNDPYRKERVMDPERVGGFVRGLTNPEKDLKHKIIQNYIKASEDFADSVNKHYDIPAAQKADVQRVKDAALRFKSNLNDASEALSLVNKYERLAGRGGLSQVLGGMGAVANPQTTIRVMANLERYSKRVDSKITNGISDFLSGGKSSVRAVPHESTRDIMEKAHNIVNMAGNVEILNDRIQHTVGHQVGAHAPNVAGVVAHKLADSYSFLASKAPMLRGAIGASITPQFERARYNEEEARKFGRYLDGVQRPLSILDDLKHGTISREKVEAVRATSPRLYDQIREEVINQASELGDKLPYDKKLQLGILFQAPTDETLTPGFIQLMQQTTAPPAPEPNSPKQQKGGGRRPMKHLGDDLSTGSEQVASRQE